MEFIQAIERITTKPRGKVSFRMASITVLLVGMQEELPFLMALCVAYWKMKIMSRGGKSTVQKSSACLSALSQHSALI
jgi:Ca2+-transporting ATPase